MGKIVLNFGLSKIQIGDAAFRINQNNPLGRHTGARRYPVIKTVRVVEIFQTTGFLTKSE